jgi:hypothetical protein
MLFKTAKVVVHIEYSYTSIFANEGFGTNSKKENMYTLNVERIEIWSVFIFIYPIRISLVRTFQ